MANFQILRKKYPKFVYDKFDYKIVNGDLKIVFFFSVEPDLLFRPEIIIESVNKKMLERVGKSELDNLIFHLGLIEISSYWKATCSPEILIRAGHLNREQLEWWKMLLIDGMGQFYYENKIDWRKPGFLNIAVDGKKAQASALRKKLKNRYLVPFAGGRDSIVTLETLKGQKKEIALFTLNTIGKIQKTVKITGIKKQIIARRIIDKRLLRLNKKGYLNGHTPFTALLSFLSVFCAVVFDYKNIAFSNEKSADEGNVKYLGRTINHQWAKSSGFEKCFKVYAKKFLAKDVNYFSQIRRFSDLEISKKLCSYPQYFFYFSSCNAGMKINAKGALQAEARWCGNCPKCLFVYLTLYPYLEEEKLIEIFGRDIFENKILLPILKQLVGQKGHKPFECVGTLAESKAAFRLAREKAGRNKPYLLRKIRV